MWQIINVEPADGECSICRSHECGIVDGKHQWIMSDYLGQETDRVYIGYKCVKLFAENLGITKHFVDRIVMKEPTDEQILNVIKEAMKKPGRLDIPYEPFEPIPDDTLVPRVTAEHTNESKAKTHPRSKAKTAK